MVNLTAEMAQLWSSLAASKPGQGRVVQFVAATRGEGTSTISREFARFAAGRCKRPVWLVDLDLLAGPQHAAIAADPKQFGELGPAAAATPNGKVFFSVQPPTLDGRGRPLPDAGFLCAHQVGTTGLWITRFRRELLKPGQRPLPVASHDYWSALRRHADLVVVDSPAAERSSAAMLIAPVVDATVLVVAAEGEDTRAPAALRDAIEQAGGRCAGLVFNRARVKAPSFLRAILP